MKYYVVCNVTGDYEYELRSVAVDCNKCYSPITFKYLVYKNELEALRECNEVNLNRERPICVVKELEV